MRHGREWCRRFQRSYVQYIFENKMYWMRWNVVSKFLLSEGMCWHIAQFVGKINFITKCGLIAKNKLFTALASRIRYWSISHLAKLLKLLVCELSRLILYITSIILLRRALQPSDTRKHNYKRFTVNRRRPLFQFFYASFNFGYLLRHWACTAVLVEHC